MGIELSASEEAGLLASSRTGIITTVRSDGWPISLPVWFAYLDGAIYLRTPTRSKKVARVRNDARACFVVEAGEAWTDLHAVIWLGRLTEVVDPDLLERVGAALGDKYRVLRTSSAKMPEATKRHYGSRDTMFEMRPDERRLSWDNRKLRAGS
ncbi:MAG: pyridoxamine 5-phosphate oxidase-related FMN-binding [Ilumatobacteraceae bacterium]|nr:pyridoxamine 5-phosphate oxidase-related FMN-binding [Ilumatobacteraceae bacterium]